MTSVKLEGQKKRHALRDTDSVFCPVHKVTTTWGEMDDMARLCLTEGLDTGPELRCLLLPSEKAARV